MRKILLFIFILSIMIIFFYHIYGLNSSIFDQIKTKPEKIIQIETKIKKIIQTETKTEKIDDSNNDDNNNIKNFLNKRLNIKSKSYYCKILPTQLTSLYGKFPYLISAPKSGSSDFHYSIYDGVSRSLNTTLNFNIKRIHTDLNEFHVNYNTKSNIQKQVLNYIPIFGHSIYFDDWKKHTSDLIEFHNCILEFFALVSKNNQIGGSTYRDPRECDLSMYYHNKAYKNKYEKYDFQLLLKYMIFNQIVFNIKPNLAFLFSLNEFSKDKLIVRNKIILSYNFTATVDISKEKQLKYGDHQTWRNEWKRDDILEASCLIQKLTPTEIYQNYIPKSQYEINVSSDCLLDIIKANHSKNKRKSLDQFMYIISFYLSDKSDIFNMTSFQKSDHFQNDVIL